MAGDADLRIASAHWHADGSFGYLSAIQRKSGKLSERLGVLGDGRVVPRWEAEKSFRETHAVQWGKLSYGLARQLFSRPDEEQGTFFILYDRKTIAPAVLDSFAKEIDPQAYVSEQPDFLSLSTDKGTLIQRLSRAPFVISIMDGSPQTVVRTEVPYPSGVSLSDQSPSTSSTTESDWHFNAKGLHAEGIKVGLMELVATKLGMDAEGCQIWESHEAFTQATVGPLEAQFPGTACSSDSGCTGKCQTPATCEDEICRDIHATQVASRIAAYSTGGNGQPVGAFHAARATIRASHPIVPVQISPSLVMYMVTPVSMNNSYADLVGNGVLIVNESIGRFPKAISDYGWGFLAVLADEYSRSDGLVVVQSTGNKSEWDDSDFDTEAMNWGALSICEGLNPLCVGGVRWAMPGGPRDLGSFEWTFSSAYRNLKDLSSGVSLEIEDPDVSAEAELAHVVDFGSAGPRPTDAWMTGPGLIRSRETMALNPAKAESAGQRVHTSLLHVCSAA